MVQLHTVLGFVGIGVFALALVSTYCLRLFMEKRGILTTLRLEPVSILILSVLIPTALVLLLSAVYLSGGLMSLGLLALVFILLPLARRVRS